MDAIRAVANKLKMQVKKQNNVLPPLDSKKALIINELHKPARRNYPRRRTVIKGYSYLFQADLAEFIPFASLNRKYRYILIVINCYSKFVWARPLKSKNGREVALAIEDIFKSVDAVPNNFQTDQGTEFYNTHVSKIMKQYGVNHYSTFSTKKAAIAERVIRTLKGKLYKAFDLRGKHKWIDILEDIVASYNHTKHRTIQMRPDEVTPDTKLTVYNYLKLATKSHRSRFKVGDIVRISKQKTIFTKGYLGNWTMELFKIIRVKLTSNPVTLLLEDMNGQPISGCFYAEELQKTLHPSTYLIEKVIKRRCSKLYVKWMGHPERTWINASDIE